MSELLLQPAKLSLQSVPSTVVSNAFETPQVISPVLGYLSKNVWVSPWSYALSTNPKQLSWALHGAPKHSLFKEINKSLSSPQYTGSFDI